MDLFCSNLDFIGSKYVLDTGHPLFQNKNKSISQSHRWLVRILYYHITIDIGFVI